MNTFAHLERLADFQCRKVKYFSVCFEEAEVNEFFDFLNRMEEVEEMTVELSNLLVWLEEIGEHYGAQKRFFRNEAWITDAQALPPPSKQMRLRELEVNDLRLYCLVLNENVVILFNGGIKTKTVIKAQDCPNVGGYFKQANRLAAKIHQLMICGEVQWNRDHTDIIYDDNLEIEL